MTEREIEQEIVRLQLVASTLMEALREFVNKAHPRASVVNGKTTVYIVERSVYDTAREAIKSAASVKATAP